MNFLALIPIFSTLIERLFPDKAKADEAKIEMQKVLAAAEAQREEAEAKKMQAQSEVIKTELSTDSWMSKNWRALLMMIATLVVANYYIITPILNALLTKLGMPITAPVVPSELWTLLSIGLGGYVGTQMIRTNGEAKQIVEQTKAVATIAASPNASEEALAAVLRSKIFTNGMTQAQWDAVQEALVAGGYKK